MTKNKKKWLLGAIAVLCGIAVLVSCFVVGKSCLGSSSTDYSNSTLTGTVTAVDGSRVTLAVGQTGGMGDFAPGGEMNAPSDQNGDGSTPPEKPDGESASGSGDSQPPELPDGNGSGSTGSASDSEMSTPPEKPDGESTSGNGDNQPPELPDGNGSGSTGSAPDGEMGTPPDQNGESEDGTEVETVTFDFSSATITSSDGDSLTVDDLKVGDVLLVQVGEGNTVVSATVQENTGMSGGMGGSASGDNGTAATTLSEDATISGETYESTGDDENALRVDGAAVTLENITVNKTAGSSSSADNGDFYGANAGLLAQNGATVNISDATVNTSVKNGNGVFSYGEGTTVNISDSTITTTGDCSGGIQTTGGGTTNATNLTIHTSGSSSAAIRSDRGGGTVNVDGGTYTTDGTNSPAVYSTADITVKNATLTANGSEALVIEGENSITLENCDVSGKMSEQGSSADENIHGVMIYQSMSGDADVGTSSFSMTGGSLTGYSGDLFYITNTHCTISLNGVSISQLDEDGVLMRIAGNSASKGWGTAGSNGGQVDFTASGQTLSGDIVVDAISTLNFTLSSGSTYTGAITIVDNEEGGAAVDNNAVVTVEEGCTWTLTGNCTLTSLTNNGTIDFNGYTITLADGTVLS